MGKRILLVEVSATLRHAAKKLLVTAGYSVIAVDNFADGMLNLSGNIPESLYDGVILGWPAKTDCSADELFAALMEPEYTSIAAIVLSYQADANKLTWVSKRSNTAVVVWDEYSEIIQSLNSLITINTPRIEETMPIPELDSMRVLFVDDSPTIRVSYRRLLTEHGYVVDTAGGVQEGLEKALSTKYDIVISDYYMPDGTGDTLCAKLRDDSRTCNVVTAILTGTYSDKAIISSLAAGAVECMFKNEAEQLFIARINAMGRSIRATKDIKNDHTYLEGILTSVGDGVYGVDNDGVITFVNPAAKKILGYGLDEVMIGSRAFDLFHNIGQDGESLTPEQCFLHKAYINGEKFDSWMTFFRHKRNLSVPVECTIYPLIINKQQQGSVVAFRDISERKLLLEEIKWRTTHDMLTKLPNRSYFESQLFQEVERLGRSSETSLLLYVDLDQFKYLNDTAGHIVGDQLLTKVSRQLRKRLRAADTLARIGGDEFAIIMRNVRADVYFSAADKFRDVISKIQFSYTGKSYTVNASVGVDIMNAETSSAGEALANADIACFVAKGKGRNTTHFYNMECDEKSVMDVELGWSNRLQEAIAEDAFELHFQPILDLDTVDVNNIPLQNGQLWQQVVQSGEVSTLQYEVLLRLKDNNGELIYPGSFLPTAERFNLIPEIDKWVIRKVMMILSAQQSTSSNIRLSINISAQTLEDEGLAEYIIKLSREYQINPKCILFEITETSAIANLELASRFIVSLHGLGFRFALDDFGSGFCSFSHLKYLPVDEIKIDGIFVQGMLNDTVDRAIINSVVQIGHSVGKKTVAEFVENVDILIELKKLGVDAVQGIYVDKPKSSFCTPVIPDGKMQILG